MKNNKTQINCPSCGHPIDVQDILAHQLEEEMKQKYQSQLIKLEQQQQVLMQEKQHLEQSRKQQDELLQEKLSAQLKQEKLAIEQKLKAKLADEQSEQLALLQKELNEKSEQVKELNRTRAEIEALKREKEELKESVEIELQKKLTEVLQVEKEKVKRTEEERNEMRVRELQKQLEDQKKLTEEMKRRQEQGSVQLQGEVQELGIEEWLTSNFPLDTILEIKKGERGADSLQTVNTRTKLNCGTIYYESKRAKDFKVNWIEKFREDIREKGADIGVLVTDVFPKGMERMGMVDGIWVCSYEEFKGLCVVLRETIIQLNNLVAVQENKGDKMNMLYDFLTSNEFRLQVEAIVEGFTQMQIDLNAEKRAITGHWKKREKQIQKVLLNTNYMYNSIKGIAGSAIKPIKTLELVEFDIDDTADIE